MILLGRLFWVKTVVCVGLILGLVLSFHLWAGFRVYPLSPVITFLRPPPFPFDYVVFGTMVLLLGFIVATRDASVFVYGLVGVALVCALFDQSRWQPWFYQYLFMLVAVRKNDEAALTTCRLIVVCIYFWSGIQKINPGFVYETFGWMVGPVAHFLPGLGFVAALTESAIGVGLLVPRFRRIAVVMAVAMHVFILASIGPFGHNLNRVVWPWNVAMCALVILLFWRTPDVRVRDVVWGRKRVLQRVVLLLFGILPALSLVDRWDSYLSFSLYSGNQRQATIYMADPVAGALPGELQEVIDENTSKVDTLDVREWSYSELNVPPYPEVRVYRNVGKRVCDLAGNSPRMIMVVTGKRNWFRRQQMTVYTCADLAAW
jgi:uncharacterized membrane protein YphA (DoxX/SURF4 family)